MYKAYVDFARRLAEESGKVVAGAFRRPLVIEDKIDLTPVTQADKESERVMREMIAREFPSHGIVGEEYGVENENAEFVWVLDPIDGTQSFIAGVPLFGTLIALLQGGRPVLGVINQPFTRECWLGVEGERTTLNGAPVSTRPCAGLAQAIMFSTADKKMFAKPDDKAKFDALCGCVKSARFSTDCYGYGLVASGCGDIVCEADLNLYDYAALVPIVCGAGGVMTDWRGEKLFSGQSDGHVLALGDARLLPAVTEALNA